MLPSSYQEFIYKRTYARWVDGEGRRENWMETIARYEDFFGAKVPKEKKYEFHKACDAIRNLEAMPSMRALWVAGPAAERENMGLYNCSYLEINTVKSFSEILYILMNGTGVGFSVERQVINKLPEIPSELVESADVIVVADSKRGWAEAYNSLLQGLYAGVIKSWDVSKVRPKGSKLKVFGGRASGPDPLVELFKFTVRTFKNAKGRKLNSLEVHDICCKVASIVVVGGTRRSACISLSNLSDDRMANAKQGFFWEANPQRMLANNSVAYTEKPDPERFIEEWLALIKSKSGERGIFNRESAKFIVSQIGRRDSNHEFGCNPCSEIVLRPNQVCNLSEVVIRPDDTLETLKTKVRYATILGIIQATYTDFKFVGREWKKNCDEERLLGVSLTGLRDHPVLSRKSREAELMLVAMKQVAIDTAEEWSKVLQINMPAAISAIKPSGCRPWDAITTTKDGIFTIEEMLKDHPQGEEWADCSGEAILEDGSCSSIKKTYDNGKANIVRVNLRYGVALDSTANHQWFVSGFKNGRDITPLNKWIRADEIVSGHIIENKIGLYRKESSSNFANFNPASIHARNDVTLIKQPNVMDEDIAWFLGYLWGDGAMSPSSYRIRFIDENEFNLEKVLRIVNDKFGIVGDIKDASEGRKAKTVEFGSKVLWHWLIKNGVWKYYANNIDIIPEIVRRSSKSDIIAFISGMYDADGWCGKSGKQTFATASEMFSRHIQHVALSVGLIFGRSKNVGGDNLQRQKEMYLMSVGCGCDAESFSIFKKNSCKMQKIENEHKDVLWNGLKEQRYTFGLVQSVEEIGEASTYDIETDCHWYMNGAFKSHNTVSQLVDSASGLHPRYAPYYIRRVRVNSSDPLAQMLIDAGVNYAPEVGETFEKANTWVFDFPMKAPVNAVFRDEETAIQQLEYWLMLQKCWCEQKPSVTIYVKDDEWLEVGNWVYKNWNYVSGISFLPFDGGVYQLAPYEEITEDEYNKLIQTMPELDFNKLIKYEREDTTEGSREFACQGGACELA